MLWFKPALVNPSEICYIEEGIKSEIKHSVSWLKKMEYIQNMNFHLAFLPQVVNFFDTRLALGFITN